MRPLILPALLMLAACVSDQNMTLNSVHVPEVSVASQAIDLNADAFGLAPGESQRLDGWLAGLQPGPGDRLSADAAAGTVRDAVARSVGRWGKLLEAADPAAVATAGRVRVTAVRATASVTGCPNWRDEQKPVSAGATSRNYGCAMATNLAAMIADPQDLLRGRDAGGAPDPRVSVKAIGAWREAKPTGQNGLKAESAAGGK